MKTCTASKLTLCLTAVLLAVFLPLTAQTVPGEWQLFPACHNAVRSVRAFSQLFVLSDGALYSYDDSDGSIRIYDKNGVLNDYDIADIDYCSSQKAVVICYKNGNIDLLYDKDEIRNIPDILNSSLQYKEANEVRVYGDNAFVSTESGLVVLDLKKREVRDIYTFSDNIRSSLLIDGSLICLTSKGIYSGKMADNLKDPANWKMIFSSSNNKKLHEHSGNIIMSASNRDVYQIDRTTGQVLSVLYKSADNVSSGSGFLYVQKGDKLYIHIPDKSDIEQYTVNFNAIHILKDNNTYWISAGTSGVLKCSVKNAGLSVLTSKIIPDSPIRNYFEYLKFTPQDKLLVAGGSHNYNEIYYPGTIMTYDGNNWNNIPEDGIKEKTGLKYENLTSLVEDPDKQGHFFASSVGHGLYEFDNNEFIKQYTYNNSALCTILPDDKYPEEYIRVNGLQYDANGNLWMLNNQVDTIFRILKKDGKWAGLKYSELSGFSLERLRSIYFDSNNKIWTASTFKVVGLFCADLKDTPFDSSDDEHYFSSGSFTNQDNITVEINDIYFFEKDHNGIMWIGTDQGIFILDNPDSFIKNKSSEFKRIKIPRNDGSGYADYLFGNTTTTAICVDFANRKWIGTNGKGIFLLDETGTETILHFNTENSPLPSDNILSIAMKASTGEIFIGTDKGLAVYGGNAFKPEKNLEKSNIRIYPNPVLPEYEGKVTIQGLTYNSTVKILNSSGRLVYQAKSDGGGFTWNFGNGENRVPSGVYYVMIVDDEGNNGIVSTLTIIR